MNTKKVPNMEFDTEPRTSKNEVEFGEELGTFASKNI